MSNDTKWTRGPWKAHFEEAYFVTGPDLGRVAMMMNLKGAHGMGGRRSGSESAANARLIASAPELYEALHRLEVSANSAAYCYSNNPANFAAALVALRDDAEQARAALARARGETA